ncbi:MAG: ATP-binding protein [Planctomycetota bacterium]
MSESRIEAQLKLKSDVALLGLIGDWLCALARGVPGTDLVIDLEMNLRLIITELFTNCIRHAYAGRSDGDVQLDFAATEDKLELGVHDWGPGPGKGFDVEHITLPPNNAECAGGRGLFLVRQLVHKLSYERSGERSTFRVVIDIPAMSMSDDELLAAVFGDQSLTADGEQS